MTITKEAVRAALTGLSVPAPGNAADGMQRVAPVVTYDQFLSSFEWRQHEHIGMIGPTGGGKTTLALQLIDQRDYVTVLGTKPQDPVLDSLKHRSQGKFRFMKEWKDYDPALVPRRLLWPPAKDLYSMQKQQRAFRSALHGIYHQGGWCIYVDELWYVIHHLKLELEVRTFLQQARALNISLLALTQRPAFVPLELYDQSTHLFFWGDNDKRNLDRISGISYQNANIVRDLVSQLDEFQVLYLNTRKRKDNMMRFTPPAPEMKEG
jgi:hypothetical protein